MLYTYWLIGKSIDKTEIDSISYAGYYNLLYFDLTNVHYFNQLLTNDQIFWGRQLSPTPPVRRNICCTCVSYKDKRY